VFAYTKEQQKDLFKVLRAPVIQLSPTSIAKVCFTDEATVTAMLTELIA
jgi:hypothetical protein